jgi:hypothetical protein
MGTDQPADDDPCGIDQRRQSRQRMEILSLQRCRKQSSYHMKELGRQDDAR